MKNNKKSYTTKTVYVTADGIRHDTTEIAKKHVENLIFNTITKIARSAKNPISTHSVECAIMERRNELYNVLCMEHLDNEYEDEPEDELDIELRNDVNL
jgi:hypothetical protein